MNRLKRHSAGARNIAITVALSGLVNAALVSPVFAEKSVDKVNNGKKTSAVTGSAATKPDPGVAPVTEPASEPVTELLERPVAQSVAQDESKKPSGEQVSASRQVAADTVDGAEEKKKKEAILLSNQAADHYNLATHYMHKFDWEMAEVELEAAIMCSPEMKAAHRDYCVVSAFRGQPMRSVAEFMMVVGLGDPIPLSDSEKVALNKKAAKLHYEKGLNYGVAQQWKKATPEFQCAMGYAPNSSAIAHSLAFSYAAAGDFEQAESEYLKAFALDPNNSYSHADFAMLLSEHGDQKKAMEQLATAISLSPNVAALHVDMAWLAESNGDLKKAEAEFHEAVHLSPKHAGLWSHLGRVEERLGKARDAKSAYSEALAVDPGDDEAKTRLDVLNKSGKAAGSAPAGDHSGDDSGSEDAPLSHTQNKQAS
jgi:Flp pilus assembly protein TadD